MDIPALPFSNLVENGCKPLENNMIVNPTSIGEKLRNRRLRLGLLQKDVAKAIGVCEESITLWENNLSKPTVSYYPHIIKFLGYIPFDVDVSTLSGQIKLYRYLQGLTQKNLAHKLSINE